MSQLPKDAKWLTNAYNRAVAKNYIKEIKIKDQEKEKESLAQIGSRAAEGRDLVQNTGPWLSSKDLWAAYASCP